MPDQPRVSVVIPTHNRPDLTLRALASVDSQTLRPHEVIVVDDGSTDDTPTVLAGIEGIRVFRLSPGKGAAAARNHGVAEATGDLIAFLDSDDEWLPTKLERQVPVIVDSPKVGAVYCRHFDHDDSTGVRLEPAVDLLVGDITDDLLSGRCPRTVSLFVVRRDALIGVGGFDEELRGFQDTDLWIRLSPNWDFAAVDEALVIMHNHPGERITTDLTARREALDQLLGRWGQEMKARIGPSGVERYVTNQLAVAQGSVVLSRVRLGRRLAAFGELGRYLRIVGPAANPTQLTGLVVACVGGWRAHLGLKTLRQRSLARRRG